MCVESTLLCEAYLVSFWMRKFGHKSLKRSLVLSNSPKVRKFDKGQLTKEERDLAKASCVHYVDRHGQKRFHGGKTLKASQPLGLNPPEVYRATRESHSRHSLSFHGRPALPRVYTHKFARALVGLAPRVKTHDAREEMGQEAWLA